MSNAIEWTAQQQEAALQALRRAETDAVAAKADPALKDPYAIGRIGIIGGGTMGAGIAVSMLNAGYSVQMIERDAGAVHAGCQRVLDTLTRDENSGRISPQEHAARKASFAASSDYQALSDADLVIEAVFEDLDVKRDVFGKVTAVCREETILATNTSYLNPEAIFKDIAQPARCVGLHFFSPANIMKLVEIVPTQHTSEIVVSQMFALAAKCHKIPVQAGICDGFIGNRILKTMRSQAERVLLFGVTPQDVDAALRAFGMKMGPFEVQDLAGLDIASYQRQAAKERGEPVFAPVSERLVAAGRIGRKSGAGWYDYTGSTPNQDCPETVRAAIDEARIEAAVSKVDLTQQDIIETVLFAMLNEAANILAEGIAQNPSDIDLVEVYGYGFPRDKGGLAWFGATYGLSKVVDRLTKFSKAGISNEPTEALIEWARTKS